MKKPNSELRAKWAEFDNNVNKIENFSYPNKYYKEKYEEALRLKQWVDSKLSQIASGQAKYVIPDRLHKAGERIENVLHQLYELAHTEALLANEEYDANRMQEIYERVEAFEKSQVDTNVLTDLSLSEQHHRDVGMLVDEIAEYFRKKIEGEITDVA